jgi:cytochrome c biogenesis protein CcmG/thiol:disulfide interchange protein DsbE
MIKKLLPAVLLAILWLILFRGLHNPSQQESKPLGQRLPKIRVYDLRLRQFRSLNTWLGKPFILHFWASWCENCRMEVPVLAKYKDLLPIIGVNYKDTPEAAKNMMALWNDTFSAIYADKDGRLGLELGVIATPETLLVDASGKVVFHYQGLLSDSLFTSELLPRIRDLK